MMRKPAILTNLLLSIALILSFAFSAAASSTPYISKHGINIASGNKYISETDISLKGPVSSLVFSRKYNNQSELDTILGRGWSFSSRENLRFISNQQYVLYTRADGKRIYFRTTESGVWENFNGPKARVRTTENGYALQSPDGTIKNFDENGRITNTIDRNNNTTTYTYTGENLSAISDDFGRTLTLEYNENGYLKTITSPVGIFTYAYDDSNNLHSVQKPDGSSRAYLYEDPRDKHNLTGIIDESGERILTVTYDVVDRVTSSELQGGANTVFIEYQNGYKRVVTNSLGETTTYQLTKQNGEVRVSSIDGPGCSSCGSNSGTTYSYNKRQQVQSERDGNGILTEYGYDENGFRTTVTKASGTPDQYTTSYQYDTAVNKKSSITVPSVSNPGQKKVTSMVYDDNGNMLFRTESGFRGTTPNARTTGYTYDSYGRVTRIDGPRSDVDDSITINYYPNEAEQGLNRGHLHSVSNALGHSTTYSEYNAFGQAERIVDANGVVTTRTFNNRGLLTSSTTAGSTTSYAYNTTGDLLSVTRPGNRILTYGYDSAGRVNSISDNLGNTINYSYDSEGRKTAQAVHDPDGALTTVVNYEYDDYGRVSKILNPDDTSRQLGYDAVGNLVNSSDEAQRGVLYDYDALNRRISTTQPGERITRFTYDIYGNQTSTTDANGNTTSFTYDDFGNRLTRTSPDTGVTSYEHDPAGNIITETDAKGITTTYRYDALNRLLAINYPDSTLNVNYSYDEGLYGKGRLTGISDPTGNTDYSYDRHGNLVSEIRQFGDFSYSLAYGYNENSELSSITYPSGRTINYQRNAVGQVTSVTTTYQGTTTSLADEISYLPFGPQTEMTLAGALTVANTYDQRYRLVSSTSGTLYNRDYAYYDDGSVMTITDNIDPEVSQHFSYDELNRLQSAQGNYGTLTWSHDDVGNRLSRILDSVTTNYVYEAGSNRLLRSEGDSAVDYFYDEAGNITQKGGTELLWDDAGRLRSVASNAQTVGSYDYDSRNLRTTRTVDNQTFHALYDRAGNITAELNDRGEILREFAYLNGTRLSLFDYTANREIYVHVTTSEAEILEGVTVYAFDEQNRYTGISAVTDAAGAALFLRSDFTSGDYTFQVNYLAGTFVSDVVDVRDADEITIVVPVEQVDLTVMMAGATLAGTKVYVDSADGSYLGIYATTDSSGAVSFTLAEGVEYSFRTEILGNSYASEPLIVSEGGSSSVIDAGGGRLRLAIGEAADLPLSGLPTYLYNGEGTYLGLAATSDGNGQVSYVVPDGNYTVRVDYLGYQLWSAGYGVSEDTEGSLIIPHRDVTLFVGLSDSRGKVRPAENIAMTLTTPQGDTLGLGTTSDHKGEVLFHLPELEFVVAASYADQQFLSSPFIWEDREILIDTGSAAVTVTSRGSSLRDVPVTVLAKDGRRLDISAVTNSKGEAEFLLPPGDYLFQADYQGHHYYSATSRVEISQTTVTPIEVGGSSFVLKLATASGEPLTKVATTLFTAGGIELDAGYATDNKGRVSYAMADGSYRIRIDYLGYSYWTDPFSVPATTALDYVIAHREVTVAVSTDYNGDLQPLKNLNVNLFTPQGDSLKVFAKVGKDYSAHILLPEKSYIYQVEYLDQLFESEPTSGTEVEIAIAEGIAEVVVQDDTVPLGAVTVEVFGSGGVPLGLTGVTAENGAVSFWLPAGSYSFQAEQNEERYWAVGEVEPHRLNTFTMVPGGDSIALTVQSGAVPLAGVPCHLYDTAGVYQDQSATTDSLGMVRFNVAEGDYFIVAEYLGYTYTSPVLSVPGNLAAALQIEHQQVDVPVTTDNGVVQGPLADVRCTIFTEDGVQTGIITTTDKHGKAHFSLPFNRYRVRVDYLGGQYWSDTFDWFNTDITIPLGNVSLQVSNGGTAAVGGQLHLFDAAGTYLGVSLSTDVTGSGWLAIPAGSYQFRVDYNGRQYWSELLHVLAYQDNPFQLALDLLALEISNNPAPPRYDGTPPVYRPLVASAGPLVGLFPESAETVGGEPRTYFYIADHLGTSQLLVDDQGVPVWQGNYTPFGTVDIVVNDLENNFRFPGQTFDPETGLHYNWNRYYDPETGRYISADPIGLDGGMNLYAYVGGNPVNAVDPRGLCLWDLCTTEAYVAIGLTTATAAWLSSPAGQEALRNAANGFQAGWHKICANAKAAWIYLNETGEVQDAEETGEPCNGDECEEKVTHHKTKDGGPRVKVHKPDGSVKDITEDRVKEWVPEPRNPKGNKRKEYDGTEPTKKWPNDRKKRAPRPDELDLLRR